MRWINANQLENWAQTVTARDQFPGLVADLIRASSQDIATMRFPSGDKGQVRGFDGHLVSETTAFNIPTGKSFWELGTNADYKVKANSDFKKRTAEVSEAEQSETTYVFVSPWTWDSSDPKGKLENWIADRKASSCWKDIRYIDGSALETWLEQRPAVAAWHARNTLEVRPQEGVRSTDEFWHDFSGQFRPPLTEEVLLCERDAAVQQLIAGLLQPQNAVTLVADSPDEVVAFAIAAMRRSAPDVRLLFESRTLVIDSIAAGRQLFASDNLILLLRNEAARSPSQFSAVGSTLVPLGRQQRGGGAQTLARPSGFAMGTAMKSMGLEENRALTLARGCGRSLTALARLIPGGASDDPAWLVKGPDLLTAILAGAWDSANNFDREIVELISGGAAYSQVEGHVRAFLRNPDPPLDLEGTVWKVRAPMDAFIRVGTLIGPAEAQRLREAMLAVFSRVDPDVKPDDEVLFATRGPTGHSEWLKDGLATTLLLFAVWSGPAEVNLGSESGQDYANRLLVNLPGLRSDPRVLMSLKNELPLLAEAAPDPLLLALEHMLEGTGELIRPIFDEQKGLLFPTYNHTGVLWALETLAWDPDYFRRAVLVLARLAEIAPDIRLVNTPANSLAEIFVLWNPNTNASSVQRLSALREIASSCPEVGWKLVLTLLPNVHASSMATPKPKLREAGASDRPAVTYRELWENQAAVAELAINLAGESENRWIELIRSITAFAPAERNLAITALDRLMSRTSGDRLKRLWSKVRDEAARHARFESAAWALPPDQLAPFLDLVARYAPSDPITPVAALFGEWTLDQTNDIAKSNEERAAAVLRLYNAAGPEAVLRLAAEAKVPYLVIEAIAGAGFDARQVEQLLSMSFAQAPGSAVTINLAGLHRRLAGARPAEAWVRGTVAAVNANVIADLLRSWPEDLDTWNTVRRFGEEVVASYWSRRSPSFLTGSRRTLLRSLLMQLRYGRAVEAIESSLNRIAEVPTRLLLRMLDGVIPQLNLRAAVPDTMTTYYVEKALESLDGRPDGKKEEIAAREFAFFPLLEHGNRSLRIHELMASDPAFYHQILREVFRGESDTATELDAQAKMRARVSYSLLSHFSQLPGLTPTGLDAEVLASWVDSVRRLGEETDRAAVTYNYIGRMLAHAPPDEDGGWPHRAVRDQIERLRSGELERGLQLARYNMRGVHGKQVFEGGDQERVLAQENARSAAIALAWPRTSALLTAIANGWERDAQREDIEAEQRKMRS